ncbi:hypothetical protein IAT38_002359 [Cryptococcus sp. DSM 104549]
MMRASQIVWLPWRPGSFQPPWPHTRAEAGDQQGAQHSINGQEGDGKHVSPTIRMRHTGPASLEEDDGLMWDEHHNDPHGDVVIASGARRWRLSSYFLKKDSELVRHLCSGPVKNRVIELDIPALPYTPRFDPVRTFLAAITTHDEDFVRHIKRPEQYESILRLCDFFQSEHIEAKVLRHLEKCETDHGWDMFVVAAKRDDVPMAKVALRCMERAAWCPVRQLHLLSEQDLKDIPSAYLLELFRQRLSAEHTIHGISYTEVGWEAVGREFDPHRVY